METPEWLAAAEQVPSWGYLLLFLATAAPLLPNGSLVIACAALAGQGYASAPLIVLVVVAGTVCGDLALYGVARRLRRCPLRARRIPAARRIRRRFLRLLREAAARTHRHGLAALILLRFLPGGRATGAVAAGLGEIPAARYAAAAVLAEAAWTGLYVSIGYGGGSAAPHPLVAVCLGLSIGCAVGIAGLLLRRPA
ncbi:VTT domain-containing protein [Streptomyces sp. NPDC001508]|uniref:DedA family protein n=1 Tax=Streptomyces sp. NPDC001508 TaxID=3154656 RepID=UPI003329A99F